MRYLKYFNESLEVKKEIEEIINDCFLDFMEDHSLLAQVFEGKHFITHHFLSDETLELIKSSRPKDYNRLFHKKGNKAFNVSFHNDTEQMELWLNENSQKEFDNSIENLKGQLNYFFGRNSYELLDIEPLKKEHYQIRFLIIFRPIYLQRKMDEKA